MRITLLLLTVLLAVNAAFASGSSVLPVVQGDPTPAHKAVHHKHLYAKGKGNIGFIAGFLLGPVGFLGVVLFSRNRNQRRRAGQALAVWGTVALLVGVTWLYVITKSSPSSGSDWSGLFIHGKPILPDDDGTTPADSSAPAPTPLPAGGNK